MNQIGHVLYVNKKCELSLIKRAMTCVGFRCLRVNTRCECQGMGNRRDGIIILRCDQVMLEVTRCKNCVRKQNPELYEWVL